MELQDWVGRTRRRSELLAPRPCELLAATIRAEGPNTGDPLPPLWHWLYFVPDASRDGLGADGHPRRGGFLPPVALRRRMFAAGSIEYRRPLRIGTTATQRDKVVSVEEKVGSSGPLVFVRTEHEISDEDGPVLLEERTVVYTNSAPGSRAAAGGAVPGTPWAEDVETDTVLLFRFSALTFNAHRIHYDRRYARMEEGYSDLVVQGPLTALLLAELARRNGQSVRAFRFRAQAPFFVGDVLHLRGGPTDVGAAVMAYRGDGSIGLDATIM